MASSWLSQTLSSVVADLSRLGESDEVTLFELDAYQWRVEMVYRELLLMEASRRIDDREREAIRLIAAAHANLVDAVESSELVPTLQAPMIADGHVGRPHFDVPLSQLEYLINSRFSVPQIAGVMGVSVSTIRRRMLQYNLSIQSTYSDVTDSELDARVIEQQRQFPGWGNRQMYGYLVSVGIRVQFQRVRDSQSRVDPEGSVLRRLQHLQRRRYSVRGPQHLWHIDGNHKLIRCVHLIGA